MTKADISKTIIDHLKQEFITRCLKGVQSGQGYYERNVQSLADSINEKTPIIEEGFIDSFGLVAFRAWLESTFDIIIPDDEAVPANFSTVKKVAKLVSKHV